MPENRITLPKVWIWVKGERWQVQQYQSSRVRRHEGAGASVGNTLQLYSLATPNGVKVTIMLEELLELGNPGRRYDAYLINIGEGDQFGSDFVAINPNSKIPALLDRSTVPPTRVFESGAILIYLAEKFDAFYPQGTCRRGPSACPG